MDGAGKASYYLLPLPDSPTNPAAIVASRGPSEARQRLYQRFAPRIQIGRHLSRKLVSYQGNKNAPGFRWLKYKEGFSASLVKGLLAQTAAARLLDPFSGAGTAPLTAASMGLHGTGIEIMPIGNLAARAIAAAANGLPTDKLTQASDALLEAIAQPEYNPAFRFPHVPITQRAFTESTEKDLAKAREFTANINDPSLSIILNLAGVSVLEEISYTRKDGQFLRWDPQSGRDVSRKLHKTSIPTLGGALRRRLSEIAADLPVLRRKYDGASAEFIDGSSLTQLRRLPAHSFDAVITSPPYANRYDYTRTYALELAYLGYAADDFKNLRQSLLSATVENRSKREALAAEYAGEPRFRNAMAMADAQDALQEALNILKDNAEDLSNRNVISLVENYFTEMALIISELGRLITPGGNVFMVNDNVRYHGEEIPVDLILSDFAEQCGFRCETIWTLKQGKGNSSQQMGRYGRQEIRKCVYHWRKDDFPKPLEYAKDVARLPAFTMPSSR